MTHYRGGHIKWSVDANAIVTLIVTSFWRHDAHTVSGLDILFSPDFTNGPGNLTNDDLNGSISALIGSGNVGLGEVVQTDVDAGSSGHYVINVQTFIVNYSAIQNGSGNYHITITMSSGARISTLINSPNKSFGFETIVIINGNAQISPETSIAPILFAPINSTWTKQIPTLPANSNSGLIFSLATPGGQSIYGDWSQISGLSVGQNDGILTLDTTGLTIGDQNTVIVLISDGSTTIAVDFILEYVAEYEVPTISPNGNLNECVYAGLSYSYTFVASTSNLAHLLTWTKTSADVDNLSLDTSVTNTLTVTFNPVYSQIGDTEIVNLQVENGTNSMISTIAITFVIKKAEIDDLITIVNCAIKDVQVQCDKITATDQIVCMREKEIEIYKDAQKRLEDNKNRFGKK